MRLEVKPLYRIGEPNAYSFIPQKGMHQQLKDYPFIAHGLSQDYSYGYNKINHLIKDVKLSGCLVQVYCGFPPTDFKTLLDLTTVLQESQKQRKKSVGDPLETHIGYVIDYDADSNSALVDMQFTHGLPCPLCGYDYTQNDGDVGHDGSCRRCKATRQEIQDEFKRIGGFHELNPCGEQALVSPQVSGLLPGEKWGMTFDESGRLESDYHVSSPGSGTFGTNGIDSFLTEYEVDFSQGAEITVNYSLQEMFDTCKLMTFEQFVNGSSNIQCSATFQDKDGNYITKDIPYDWVDKLREKLINENSTTET